MILAVTLQVVGVLVFCASLWFLVDPLAATAVLGAVVFATGYELEKR